MDFQKQLIESVEKRFGKKVSYQRDCKALSERVFEQTHEYISSATIRRLFGFLNTNSKPSRVTLDILARYCGFSSWQKFVETQINRASLSETVKFWSIVATNAKNINHHGMRSIQIKSGIPFEKTVRRPHLESLLNQFATSNYSAMALVAPGGYGKSNLIAHWFLSNQKKNHEDVMPIIISASKLEDFAYSELNIDEWLWGQIGVDAISYPNLQAELKKLPGKIVFFLDALDEISLSGIKLERTLQGIHELAKEFSKSSNTKLVITTRYATWKSLQGYILNPEIWMNIDPSSFNSDGANIPPLSYDEIQTVLDNTVNENISHRLLVFELPPLLRQTISYPFYLQLFICSYSHENYHTLTDPLNIINEFIKKKIFDSIYPEEKADILIAIAREWWNNQLPITKQQLKKLFPIHLKTAGNYFDAYHEILSFGIVNEEKVYSNSMGYSTLVSINNHNVLTSIIAQKLIEQHGLNGLLIESVKSAYAQNELYPKLISYIFSIGFNQHEVEFLKDLTLLFIPDHVTGLTNTLALCFKRNVSMQKELLPHLLNQQLIAKELILTNPDLNCINSTYRQILEQVPVDNSLYELSATALDYCNLLTLDLSRIKNRIQWQNNLEVSAIKSERVMGMWLSLKIFFSSPNETTIITRQAMAHYNSISITDAKHEFRESLLPLVFIGKRFFPLRELYKEQLNVSAHQKALDSIILEYMELTQKRIPFTPEKHHQIMQHYSQLNPNRSHFGIILGELSRSISYFYESKLEEAHICIRNAIELSSISGYRLHEMILMNILGQTLMRLGELDHGKSFISYAETLSVKSGISEYSDQLEYGI